MIKYSLIFFVLSLAVCTESFSQKQASDTLTHAISKNAVYASLNGYIMAGSAISINYDRKIIKSLWVTTGIGKYPFLGDAFKVDLKLTTLIGNRSSHLEIALGILYGRSKAVEGKYIPYHNVTIPYRPPTSYFYPAFTLGYRYQNPKGGIVFRAGIGYYEVNVGLGYSF